MQWQPIETAPSGLAILVFYKNSSGYGRIIKAKYVPKFTWESETDCEMDTEYNEETDTFYYPSGWYEMIDNWDDYTCCVVEHQPELWQHLPRMPG